MAQVRKLQSGGDTGKPKYGKFFFNGEEIEVTDELLQNLRGFNEVAGYMADSLESGEKVTYDNRADSDGYLTGVNIPNLTDRENKQLSRKSNLATRKRVAELKSGIRELNGLSFSPKQETPKEKRVFDADNQLKLQYSKADENGNKTFLNTGDNQAFRSRLESYLGDFSGYNEYKFSNKNWEGRYDDAKSYMDSIREYINDDFYSRLESGNLTENDLAIINTLGGFIEEVKPEVDTTPDKNDTKKDGSTPVVTITDKDATPVVANTEREVPNPSVSRSGNDVGYSVIMQSPIEEYNNMVIDELLDDKGNSTGFIKYIHQDDYNSGNPYTNDIIIRFPEFDSGEWANLQGKNFRIPADLATMLDSKKYFWKDLMGNTDMQKRFAGWLNNFVNTGLAEIIEGDKLAWKPDWLINRNILSREDFQRLGFSKEDAKSLVDLFNKYGNRSSYDKGQRDVWSRRNRFLVRPYVNQVEYVETKKKGGILKHAPGGYVGAQNKLDINIDPDMVLGVTDFLVSRGAIKKSSDLQAEAIKEAALGAIKSAPSEIYSRFSDAGLNQMYNDRIDRIRGAKTINTDARINMAENLMRESQADAIISERDSKMSNLISQFNDRNLQEKRSYEEIRRNIVDANRNTLGAMKSNLKLNKLNESNQLAQNIKSFIYQLRQNHAMNLQDRLGFEEKLMQNKYNVDTYNQTMALKENAYKVWNTLSDEQKKSYGDFDTYFNNTNAVEIANIRNKNNFNMTLELANNPLRKRWGLFNTDLSYGFTPYKKTIQFSKSGGKTKSHLNVDEHHFLEQMSDIRKEISSINKEILSILKRILK